MTSSMQTEPTPCSSSADDVGLYKIPQENVMRVAPILAVWLQSALDVGHGKVPLWEILQRCEAGTLQLWAAIASGGYALAAAVTELQRETCLIWLLGGAQMERWLHMIGEMERWAQLEGCTRMEIHGRRGWLKVLPEYHMAHIVMRKELA